MQSFFENENDVVTNFINSKYKDKIMFHFQTSVAMFKQNRKFKFIKSNFKVEINAHFQTSFIQAK